MTHPFACLLRSLLLLVLATATSGTASAEAVIFDDYEVHYSVFASTFLSPEVARQNDLNRSRNIGIVNISIMRATGDGGLKTVPGQVEGKVLNDIQQATFLAFRRIQEGDDVYFISEFQYRPAELLTFQITARPSGSGNAELPIRFTHKLFNDQ